MERAVASGDTESAHVDADAVLCAAVREFAPKSFSRRLLALYRNVDKWYA